MKVILNILFCCFLGLSVFNGYASDVVLLNDEREEYILTDSTVDILEDPSRKLTIDEVVSFSNQPLLWNKKKGPQVNNPKAAYWVRFTLKDLSSGKLHWLLEFYDNRLDDIQVYIPNGKGQFVVYTGGDTKSFKTKAFQHINFVFDLPPLAHSQSTTIYVRMYSNHEVYIYGLVRSVQRFVFYTTSEYFYVTIFYGILLAMAMYNFFIMLSVREKSYFYYVLYVLSVGVYSFARDGFGFQFMWPNHPEYNLFIEPIALYSLTITLLMYAREFLNTKEQSPVLDKLIQVVVLVRTLIFIVGVFVSSTLIREIYFDIPMVFLAYFAGFWSYRKGYKASRYYLIGFTALFVGFCVIVLESLGIPVNDVFAFYSFNMGVVIQLLVLSIALADRVKILLKAKEDLKDELNRKLEEMVKERTLELEDKNNQLDSFVYKASHDIKGPLRSLMGLTKVGLVDFKDSPKVVTYFEHIMNTSTKLDVVLEDLLLVTRIKNAKLHKREISFEKLVHDAAQTFKHLTGFDRIKINVTATGGVLYTDESVLYSIIQNLLENAIKYQNFTAKESFLNISLSVTDNKVILTAEDNGTGIDSAHLNRVFDMFYKVNERSIGSGLGLYILKQAVQRLNGVVRVSSEVGKGATFIIEFPL